jgi:hypothetical protein
MADRQVPAVIALDDVTACLVTRGDVSMDAIIDSLPFTKIIIYDNSRETDLAVYGRYAAVARADTPFVFVQDDDCLLASEAFEQLLAAHEPGHVVANMPQQFRHDFYADHALVGFGAIFERDLPASAFDRHMIYEAEHSPRPWVHEGDHFGGVDPFWQWEFYRGCDIIFATLTPRVLVDVAYTDRDFASADNRMWKQPNHLGERTRMLELARKVRDQ